jgi:tRNA nucleotidyltransferase (CCA-adding enzyme)
VRLRSRLPHVAEVLDLKNIDIHIYDHHPPATAPEDNISGSVTHFEPAGATVTILLKLLKEKNIKLSPDEATFLALGLYEDTGSFRYSSITPDDFLAAAWLCSQGMDMIATAELISRDLNAEQVSVLNSLLQSATHLDINGVPVVLAEIVLDQYMNDIAQLAQKMMEMENINALFALCYMHDRIHVVARSRIPDVNVGQICSALGGGGHVYAASASVKDKTLNQLKDELIVLLFSSVKGQIFVRRIMSSPVITIAEDASISEAAETMTRFGLKAVPVLEKENATCTGFLELQIAARAETHGLGHLSVTEYMQRNIRTANPADGLITVTEIIVGHRQRMVPVLEQGKLTGVVTRTDLINLLIDAPARVMETLRPKAQFERNIASLMEKLLPGAVYERLAFIGRIGDELGEPVYAVGGFVRDILLQRPNLDLDIVVEGDGIAFAHALARRLDGRVREHQKFRTAVVLCMEAGEEVHIDVATARLEYYAEPAALPTVERSSLKMDLYRRDFTINALAVQLNEPHFGQLEDFFSAQRDIKEKTIRVLHALSFVDDPTRILRAIRFEQRYNFTLGQQTQRLVKNALHLSLVERLSSARLLHEFRAICEEQNFLACLIRMEEFNVLQSIHPALKLTPKKLSALKQLEVHMRWHDLMHPKAISSWLVVLICLCDQARYPEAAGVAARFSLSKRQSKDFLVQREHVRRISRNFSVWEKKKPPASELRRALSQLTNEAVLNLIAIAPEPAQRLIAHYLLHIRNATPDISGVDLETMSIPPGPAYSAILAQVLTAKIDGLAPSRGEQLLLAASLWREKKAQFPQAHQHTP